MIDANAYSDGLTKALNRNSLEAFREFLYEYRRILPSVPDDIALEMSMRKLQAVRNGVYPKVRNEAVEWLSERGLSLGFGSKADGRK